MDLAHRLSRAAMLGAALVALAAPAIAADAPNSAPPSPAGGIRPLRVFILAGQSNMQGHARVSTFDGLADDPKTAPLLAEMRDGDGRPRVCDRAWITSVGCLGDAYSDLTEAKGKLTAGFGAPEDKIGPEFTFGLTMEKALDGPILIIKTAWGGRSLHTDFRPPSAGPYEWSPHELARCKERGDDLDKLEAEKVAATGAFYRHMIDHIRMVLKDIKRVVPDYDPSRGYELAGFVWFQGFNDLVSDWTYEEHMEPGGYDPYAELLGHLIRDVRKDLAAPRMPVVIGVMGIGGEKEGKKAPQLHFRRAQVKPTTLPEFRGNVLAVETSPFWDDDLEALHGRLERLDETLEREFRKAPGITEAAREAARRKAAEGEFNPDERKRLKGASNGGYHYLGAAKILAPIGRAFAEALLEAERKADRPGPKPGVGKVTLHSEGLHGYISFQHEPLPAGGGYTAGMGFYAAVWPLVDRPLADFQVGLPSAWIQPNNSDNKDRPLAPEGTRARAWKERGPTWETVFQTVEGGLGYWAGNHFRYGFPKFSMNATPQCYDYEVGSPGWSFFYSDEALPDDRLGIAQLSNRLLIPPDALPFRGRPDGEFLGYSWMALPFTEAAQGDPPTGDQSWTCFLNAGNFKGPIAYYIPETWSKVGKLFKDPFLDGRGLDARPGVMGGGAMEINTVPRLDSRDDRGVVYSKIPRLRFPADDRGRADLVQDVSYYSRAALYDAFKAWRDGGDAISGRFDEKGAWRPKLTTRRTRYDQAGKPLVGVEDAFETRVFEGNVWGLEWSKAGLGPKGQFPQYSKVVGDERVAVPEAAVPAETGLLDAEFRLAEAGTPYTSPSAGAWASPGPRDGPYTVELLDGSEVTYSWYRFVDQPSFRQYRWDDAKKAKLQALVEKLHASWPIDRDYMAPPTRGKLVSLDPALLVTPPKGLEVGYVPIVTKQAARKTR
ncbi:hypothetical protein OJF2_77700 [Aquisphaera giovannonii]|uniref:Sialate O-acetylesterase domain-containing protein n=1 Tax=Aquisphaera giovannonii TaxID=406548 RepID=A0A5B9WET0_9BACT|nr:sialate O-acetylesterase [Aquisphaera giovannonii]QEH39158.1 hypothetical protein OJF2_77700 [Aquisphaera giovannonii]